MAGRGALCRGQKLGEHRAGAGVDAPPDGDQYVLPVELSDTVQGVSSGCMAVRGGLLLLLLLKFYFVSQTKRAMVPNIMMAIK